MHLFLAHPQLIHVTNLSVMKMLKHTNSNPFHQSGMGILRIFPHLRIFFQCFQSSAFLRISAVSSFNQRERERDAEKMLTK